LLRDKLIVRHPMLSALDSSVCVRTARTAVLQSVVSTTAACPKRPHTDRHTHPGEQTALRPPPLSRVAPLANLLLVPLGLTRSAPGDWHRHLGGHGENTQAGHAGQTRAGRGKETRTAGGGTGRVVRVIES
jgi:hypothetical protein